MSQPHWFHLLFAVAAISDLCGRHNSAVISIRQHRKEKYKIEGGGGGVECCTDFELRTCRLLCIVFPSHKAEFSIKLG
jgi:hypothetical protein